MQLQDGSSQGFNLWRLLEELTCVHAVKARLDPKGYKQFINISEGRGKGPTVGPFKADRAPIGVMDPHLAHQLHIHITIMT